MKIVKKGLIGASASLIILSVLQRGDNNSYEIVQTVKKLTNESIQWKESSILPVLQKLENSGLIKSYSKVRKTEQPQKYYSIQASGKKQLQKNIDEWNMIRSVFDKLQQ